MKENIIIDGVNVTELYNDIVTKRSKIRQGASALISTNLEKAQSLVKVLVKSKDAEEIQKLAVEAYSALESVKIISEASGVEYYLPYSSNYDSHSDIMSHVLDGDYYGYDDDEEEEYNELLDKIPEIRELTNLFYSMERQSGQWNTSWC